jgi:carboxymethylenebutenolidase
VVLQEIFGVNANIRAIADEWAAAGYLAIAPDLVARQEPGVQLNPASEADRERATKLLKGLDEGLAVEDAKAALDFASDAAGGSALCAAVGYCLGGKIAFLLAARYKVSAAVSYYGVGIQSALDEAPNIAGALLLHIAEEDHLCPPDAQARIVEAIRPLGGRARARIFAGVGHAFARKGGPNFDAPSASAADETTRRFVAEELGLR